MNGINGISRAHRISSTRSPSPVKALTNGERHSRKEIAFHDEPAILRTPQGMATFLDLERELDARLAQLDASGFHQGPSSQFEEKIKEYALSTDFDLDGESSLRTVDGELGEKRKL